jgi:hypothetical protein
LAITKSLFDGRRVLGVGAGKQRRLTDMTLKPTPDEPATDSRDAQIADLKKRIEELTAELNKARGVIEGRQPLAMLNARKGTHS